MLRAAAMTATSPKQPSLAASIIILEILGSKGMRAMSLPLSVRARCSPSGQSTQFPQKVDSVFDVSLAGRIQERKT